MHTYVINPDHVPSTTGLFAERGGEKHVRAPTPLPKPESDNIDVKVRISKILLIPPSP